MSFSCSCFEGFLAGSRMLDGVRSANEGWFWWNRSLLFIEGDCKLGSYEGSDGKTHTAFNITHRKSSSWLGEETLRQRRSQLSLTEWLFSTGNFELLKRSENAETSASGDMQDGQFGASEVASA